MNGMKRLFGATGFSVFLAAGVSWTPVPGLAQANYPSRPITLFYPYGPGGGDTMVRAAAAGASKRLGQPIVVENRPGGAEAVAMQALLRETADGHTLAVASSNFTVNPFVQKLTYTPAEFAPIAPLSLTSALITVHPALPVRTLQEFVAYAKANPGKVNFGTIGNWHLLSLLRLENAAGIKVTQVPFQTPGDIQSALLGGHIDAYFNGSLAIGIEQAKLGKMRLLAATIPQRLPELPDLPSASEIVPGFEMVGWLGVLAKAGTPRPIIDRLNREFTSSIRDPETAKVMKTAGFDPAPGSSADFQSRIDNGLEVLGKLAKQAGLAIK